ncbi:hypothetical protein Aperf_G00000065603 [Anoplocephala perfoliata]
MWFSIVLVVIEASLLVSSAPTHRGDSYMPLILYHCSDYGDECNKANTTRYANNYSYEYRNGYVGGTSSVNGPYHPRPSQQSPSTHLQVKFNPQFIYNALVNMDPDIFKHLMLVLIDLKKYLLQLDPCKLKALFAGAMYVDHMSDEEFKLAIRDTDNIYHILKGIDAPYFKKVFINVCLDDFDSFLPFLDEYDIQLIITTTGHQPDGPFHPNNPYVNKGPPQHYPSHTYYPFKHNLAPTLCSNLSHSDKPTSQESSSPMPQIRHDSNSTCHSLSTDDSNSNIQLILSTFPQFFYLLSLYLLS